ncbi:MAG: Dam family site-specific DNA-(adenine-N6)-methyltransferase [Kineosporiaceae bacterium]|nr:Dam family site-specific DNA-(adenine-N6)-methyltransferase [Kineosporiaceae bacterium]MBK7624266.1 Dam family site-specific DNA-(adenine-N6)-methyltransferase [Kineosporiaceae bacterium]MBK8075261.1 Dam family site-specific DNA-(adenine-N6)-methyltransferase [Kineosporiaceae bacterium]
MTGNGVPLGSGAQPVLRWAGGKRWLVPTLRQMLNSTSFKNYHEPFLGGASVFLGILPSGKSYLADLNAELVETYQQIRDDPEGVADILRTHRNTPEYYYHLRDSKPRTAKGRAARFIFLNATSFNGIYRVNLKGIYNVPYGSREKEHIPNRKWLRAVSAPLQGTELRVADFAECIDNVTDGDLVFLDPPYTVAHNNNGFVKYNQKLFSFEDQHRLSDLVDAIKERGAFYILTNAAHSSIAQLFDKGDTRIELTRRNNVGGTGSVRGNASEYIFTNLPDCR